MFKPEFFATAGFGKRFRQDLHFSTAVRFGNRVETSGHGGRNADLQFPDAPEDEIVAAYRNIGLVLQDAGGTWSDVVHVNTCHVGGFPSVVNETIARLYRQYIQDHVPLWTRVGVEALGPAAMRFEIRVTAIIQ
jgi:enamine deaminase RidA (YjgF/YER057c/UK114 family)